jgi:hypothetical protein
MITETNTGFRDYDLNFWYKDDWTEETGTTWADTLSLQIYLYISDERGTRKYEGEVIELDLAESAVIRMQFPDTEYGTDWWVFLSGLANEGQIPASLNAKLNKLVSPYQADPNSEPTWWVTIN